MELFVNPFIQPNFFDFLIRCYVLLLFGLIIMASVYVKNPREMFKTLAWKKFCLWLIIVPCLLISSYSGKFIFYCFTICLIWESSKEYLNLLRIPPFFKKAFIFNQAVTVLVIIFSPDSIKFLPIFYLLSTFVAACIRNQMFEVVNQISYSIIGCLWIGYFLSLLVLLYNGKNGITIVIVIFGTVVVSDVFAYLIAKIARLIKIGVGPLASNISPNKIRAGVAGNIIGASISFLMFGMELELSWYKIVLIIILSGFGAAYGDLAESIIKRHAGVKDSSDLIPYHGGLLDRIDSLLFVIPIFYVVFNIKWLNLLYWIKLGFMWN